MKKADLYGFPSRSIYEQAYFVVVYQFAIVFISRYVRS